MDSSNNQMSICSCHYTKLNLMLRDHSRNETKHSLKKIVSYIHNSTVFFFMLNDIFSNAL